DECRAGQRPPFGCWLIVIGIATAAMITLNRFEPGADPTIASRYTVFIAHVSIGVWWITAVRLARGALRVPLAAAGAGLVLVGPFAGTAVAWLSAPSYYSRKSLQAYWLYTAPFQSLETLHEIYPNPEHARIFAADLERLRLNVFAEQHASWKELPVTG